MGRKCLTPATHNLPCRLALIFLPITAVLWLLSGGGVMWSASSVQDAMGAPSLTATRFHTTFLTTQSVYCGSDSWILQLSSQWEHSGHMTDEFKVEAGVGVKVAIKIWILGSLQRRGLQDTLHICLCEIPVCERDTHLSWHPVCHPLCLREVLLPAALRMSPKCSSREEEADAIWQSCVTPNVNRKNHFYFHCDIICVHLTCRCGQFISSSRGR